VNVIEQMEQDLIETYRKLVEQDERNLKIAQRHLAGSRRSLKNALARRPENRACSPQAAPHIQGTAEIPVERKVDNA
jgi:hypothetical protein